MWGKQEEWGSPFPHHPAGCSWVVKGRHGINRGDKIKMRGVKEGKKCWEKSSNAGENEKRKIKLGQHRDLTKAPKIIALGWQIITEDYFSVCSK
ncbi:hypothetical protein SUGI_0631110 [Cryptomeria japonica]|nr:hypothetical protein SUGI_0631110 [Cryptomeria japonica]